MKRIALSILWLWLFGASPVHAEKQPPLFILVGQSNMVRVEPQLVTALRSAYPDSGFVLSPIGGTRITDWQRGKPVYNAARFATMAGMGLGYEPVAIIFEQGETEAATCQNAAQWRYWFLRFTKNFRQDIGRPYLPVVYGKLGNKPDGAWPCWNIVREQQQVALGGHPAFRLFSMWGMGAHLPLDSAHYDTNGYQEMTRRIMQQLVLIPGI